MNIPKASGMALRTPSMNEINVAFLPLSPFSSSFPPSLLPSSSPSDQNSLLPSRLTATWVHRCGTGHFPLEMASWSLRQRGSTCFPVAEALGASCLLLGFRRLPRQRGEKVREAIRSCSLGSGKHSARPAHPGSLALPSVPHFAEATGPRLPPP